LRFLGIDAGRKRVGLALSDDTGLLARPWKTVAAAGGPGATARVIATIVADARNREDVSIEAIVLGLPKRLNGEETAETAFVRQLGAAVARETGLAVSYQDERLTSREAESRLAERERDWRRRKAQIDSAAAAIILQDFLDSRPAAAH
jgi:putative Holliday junction resolvase